MHLASPCFISYLSGSFLQLLLLRFNVVTTLMLVRPAGTPRITSNLQLRGRKLEPGLWCEGISH
jgi:hypothetical protein